MPASRPGISGAIHRRRRWNFANGEKHIFLEDSLGWYFLYFNEPFYMDVSKNRFFSPKWMVKIRENPIKMDIKLY